MATGLFGLIREEQEGDADNSFTKYVIKISSFVSLICSALTDSAP